MLHKQPIEMSLERKEKNVEGRESPYTRYVMCDSSS